MEVEIKIRDGIVIGVNLKPIPDSFKGSNLEIINPSKAAPGRKIKVKMGVDQEQIDRTMLDSIYSLEVGDSVIVAGADKWVSSSEIAEARVVVYRLFRLALKRRKFKTYTEDDKLVVFRII